MSQQLVAMKRTGQRRLYRTGCRAIASRDRFSETLEVGEMQRLLGFLLVLVGAPLFAAQPIAGWVFVPEYVLEEQASNHPGPRIPHPGGSYPLVEVESRPLRFKGLLPTERLRHLLPLNGLPRDSFTLEMWICHHVNRSTAGY
jgi:hypothetical protein